MSANDDDTATQMGKRLKTNRGHGYLQDFRRHPVAQRQAEAQRVRVEKSNCVPVVVECNRELETTTPHGRFHVPCDRSVAQFMMHLRHHMKLGPTMGVFLVFGYKSQAMVPPQTLMKQVYFEHRDLEDNMLYCRVFAENTFG